jgi:hypothetical protein
MLLRPWLLGSRGRRNAQRALRPLGPVKATLRQYAPSNSFVDVGTMWEAHGDVAFEAEELGATKVTAMDVSAPTPQYEAEHARRDSKVRFVQGDVHDAGVLAEVGVHDVVWCSGVLYHCPNPIHTIECLRSITRSVLILITATIPEIPGVRHASVFFPHLPERDRRAYDKAFAIASGTYKPDAEREGLTDPFVAERGFANWWWGLSPSAVEAMLQASGFELVETKTNGFHTRIVARLPG